MQWYDAVGWLGAVVLVASRWQTHVVRGRALDVSGSALLVVYSSFLGAWPVVVSGLCLVGLGLWRIWEQRRPDDERYAVLGVDPQDEYLRHVLRVHGRDILRYQPGFVWDGAETGHGAALVLSGAETVGVFVYHDLEPGVAQLELDYVTARHRDLRPGRYVFFASGYWSELGYRRVYTPPNMAGPYYERLGLRALGDRFVFDVR